MRNRLRRPWFAAACAVLGYNASTSLAATTVVVERLADGTVRVDYELDAAAMELVLADVPGPRGVDWRADWTVLSETLTLQDKRIASTTGSPFSAASVSIEPAERTALSLFVTMGARSSVIDLRLLLPSAAGEVSFEVQNAFDVRARACVDELRLEGTDAPPSGRATGWLVVASTSRDACRAAARDGDLTFLAEDAPAQLQAIAVEQFASAYRRLSEKLGRPLDPPPVLILAHKGRSGGGVMGIRTGLDSVVLASLEGDSWTAPNSRSASRLGSSLTRALAPYWLAGVIVPPPEPLRVGHWLADGAAQYLAMLDSQSLGEEVYPEPAGRMVLADIELCSRQVEAPFVPRAVAVPVESDPLKCGLLIQFVYDAITRAETAGQRTIFDLWADVLADADGGPIEAESFLGTNERARAAVAGLVYGPAADFEGVTTTLRTAGIDASLGDPRDTGGAVAPLLHAFVRNDCSEGLGGATFMDDRVKITTRGTCRTLPQELELIRIEGVGILTSAPEVYSATAEACAERGRVRLTGALATQEFELDCPASVPALAQQLYIRNVHFLN
jgi:hypothetical protein